MQYNGYFMEEGAAILKRLGKTTQFIILFLFFILILMIIEFIQLAVKLFN